jgi:hypothetical protein
MASVCAPSGEGKTHFALTFPDRTSTGEGIKGFSLDPNTDDCVDVFREEEKQFGDTPKMIEIKYYNMPGISWGGTKDIQDMAGPEWDRFLDDVYNEVLAAKYPPASIFLDTATQFSHMHLYAEHGKMEEVPMFERGKTNGRFLSFLQNLKQSGCHVALLHRMKPKYEERMVRSKKGKTLQRERIEGAFEREGNSKTDYAVNVEVFLSHDVERDPDDLQGQFGMTIAKSTSRPALVGAEIEGKYKSGRSKVTFRTLARLQYPNVEW